ncbi:SUMF1/EgtB/PvdO family nonheme iron enzyme [Zavarzinella formosa]|uniref:SUMF1/EgtB/PvdO family nonheme iron enzyme n=1 Tax=Zavarzinella formosa TaxID=360055 RepID=UPI0002EC2A89|nr:SUMF1/EgtB/PvdO family nonheme iron enzyme [Zavarzinella formosa]
MRYTVPTYTYGTEPTNVRFLLSLGIGCMAWTLAAGEPKTIQNTLGMKLITIPAGSFEMGSGDAPPKTMAEYAKRDYDEAPAHPVKISKPFLMGIHEVTNAQYEQFDPEHQKLRGRDGVSKSDSEPVTFVTWNEAVAFCDWLSKKEGKPYRLPTEAEWEYACRAGTTTPFSTGDKITDAQANIGPLSDGKPAASLTTPVGSYPANPWGLHDMHGNVMEWCLDWHGPYEAGEQTDPMSRAAGYARIARGWCFHKPEKVLGFGLKYWRSSNRSGFLPIDANRLTGFRIVQAELPATKPLPEVIPLNRRDVKQTAEAATPEKDAKPFYVNYAANGKNAAMPKDAFGPIFANHNHFAAVCVCPNGDVLACWYSTVSEQGRELAQAATRLRAGSDQWEPASAFFDVPDVNDHAPVLLRDGKRIWHFCTQSLRGWDNASNIARYSDDSGATWSQPTIILSRDDPKHLSQPCSAFVGRDGKIVLACDGDNHKDERLIVSGDNGKTWKVAAGDMRAAAGKYAIHPAVAPAKDGRIINFLRGPDPMPVQFSKDDGDTWTQKDTPFPGIHSGQKAVALRLNSGNLLLISIDNSKKVVDGGGTFAALSTDDGLTWPHLRKLDGVTGYMAAAQSPGGDIFAVGSRMSAVKFNEEWLKEGKAFP